MRIVRTHTHDLLHTTCISLTSRFGSIGTTRSYCFIEFLTNYSQKLCLALQLTGHGGNAVQILWNLGEPQW